MRPAMPRRSRFRWPQRLLWMALLAPLSAVASSEPHPRTTMVWTETPPVIDGRIDESGSRPRC